MIDLKNFLDVDYKPEKSTVLFLGSISDRKNPLLILRSLNNLRKDTVFYLTIIGPHINKEYLNMLDQYIRNNDLDEFVTIKKEIDQAEVIDFLARSSLLILPSKSEGLGRVILEAQAVGCPVLVSDSGGMKDFIEETEIPADMKDLAAEWRSKLMESVAETDESLIEVFLEEGELSQDQLVKGIREGVLKHGLVPMLCGSAFKNKGVQLLLDAVVNYLPAPVDVPPIQGLLPNGDEALRTSDDNAPFSALAFKVMADPYGKLTFVRMYSGVLSKGSYVLNSTKDEKERISRLIILKADDREEVDELRAGDLGAVLGLKNTTTGDTLCTTDDPIVLETLFIPEPVISVAVEPKTKGDMEKLSKALTSLAEEDPTFRVSTDPETNQTVIAGMGELHLEILVDRMLREFKVEANIGAPQVSYRETIRASASGEGKFARQTGGKGQYGHVVVEVEPGEPGTGFEFVNKIVGGVVPREYIKPAESGMKETSESGVIAGYPLIDVKVTLVDGSYHDVDSSEMAFKIAGSMAFKDGVRKCKPVLLEPMMKVEVEVPEDFLGSIIGDLSSRRGQVEGQSIDDGLSKVNAKVPLAEMFGYATTLRSMTQGRGIFSMEFSNYEEVPRNVAEAIISKNQGNS